MIAEPLFIVVILASATLALWFLFSHRDYRTWPAPLFGLLCIAESYVRAMQIEPASLRPDSKLALFVTITTMGAFLLALKQSAKQLNTNTTNFVLWFLPLFLSVAVLTVPGVTTNTARTAGVIMSLTLVMLWLWQYMRPEKPGSAVRKRDVLFVIVPLFAASSSLRIAWPEVITTAYSIEINTGIALLDLVTLTIFLAMSAQEWPLNLASIYEVPRFRHKIMKSSFAHCFLDGDRTGVKTLNRISEILDAPVALILPGQTTVSESPHAATQLALLSRQTITGQEIQLSQCSLPGPDNYTHSTHLSGYIVITLWDPPIDTEKAWLLIGKEVYKRYDTYSKSRQLFGLILETRNAVLQDVVLPRLQIAEQQTRISRLKARASVLSREETEISNAGTYAEPPAFDSDEPANHKGFLEACLDQFEKRLIELSLQTSGGIVNAAATLLGLDKVRMGRLMRRHQISHENYRTRRR